MTPSASPVTPRVLGLSLCLALAGACSFDPGGREPPGDPDAAPGDARPYDAGQPIAPPLGVAIPERPGVAPAQTVNQITQTSTRVAVTLSPSALSTDRVYLSIYPTGAATPLVEPAPETGVSGGGPVIFVVNLGALPDGPLTLEAWTTRSQGDPFTSVTSQARKDTLLTLAVDPVVTPIAQAEDFISGLTEPGASVSVAAATLPQPAEGMADSEGFFAVPLALPVGTSLLTVTAVDAAWNLLALTKDRAGLPLTIRRLAAAGPVTLRDESSTRLGPSVVGAPCADGGGAAFTFLGEPDLDPNGGGGGGGGGTGSGLAPDLYVACLNQAFWNDDTGHLEIGPTGVAVQAQRAVVLGDMDNDGDLDLAATRSAGGTDVFLYRNLARPLGGEGFEAVSALLGFDAQNPEGLAWLDANQDGWLDLFLQEGNSQRLFLNNGAGTGFTESAAALGLLPVIGLENGHWVAASDFDQDGDVDLVVSDDTGPGFLFENIGGAFEDRTTAQGLVFTETAKRDLAFGDMDASGSFDLFVPQGGPAGQNALLAFTPGAGFQDVAALAGVDAPPAANGAAWGDLDQDGRLDLVYYLPPAASTLTLVQKLSRGDLGSDGVPDFDTFTQDFAVSAGFAPEGVLLADVDDDGDLDVLVVSRDGAHLLLVNAVNDPGASGDQLQSPRSLRVLLRGNGVTSNRSATGAVLGVRACGPGGALLATREVSGGQGNGGQASPVLHVGGLLPSACVALTARFVGGPAVVTEIRPALVPHQAIVIFQP